MVAAQGQGQGQGAATQKDMSGEGGWGEWRGPMSDGGRNRRPMIAGCLVLNSCEREVHGEVHGEVHRQQHSWVALPAAAQQHTRGQPPGAVQVGKPSGQALAVQGLQECGKLVGWSMLE